MHSLNYKVNILFTFVCLLFSFASCNKKIKTDDNLVTFDTIRVDKIHHLNNDTSQLSCNLQISFIYPKSCNDTGELKSLQTLFIENVLSESFGNLSPQEAIHNYDMQYILNFDELNAEGFNNDDYSLEDENGFIYYLNLKNEVVFNKNNFVSFTVESENYEGGAHGSHNICGYVIDLSTGKLLDEDTFAGNNYKKNLSSVMIQKVAEANGVETAEQLENIGYINIDELAPNGNFTLDDKGITYYFNEYEIASYSVGITKVFIAYDELKVYITEDNPISSLAGLQ